MGITLDESLNACEYIASAGNNRIIVCLRGMKTNYGDPHRNFVDFAHVPVVRRPDAPAGVHRSLALGGQEDRRRGTALLDIHHVTARASSPAPTWCWSTSTRAPRRPCATARRRSCCPSSQQLPARTRLVRKVLTIEP
jgi:hypothetical protein